MREVRKLTAAGIGQLEEPGRYSDGDGLYLQISRQRTKSWLLRYQLAGRPREMGLGSSRDVSLKDARDKAKAARRMLIDGDDPIDARKAKKQASRAESAKRVMFKEASAQYIESHKAGWRSEKHAAQWTATLTTYAYPVIGNLAVSDVELGHITSILKPIWKTKIDTASRLRGRIEKVLDWAKTSGYRTGDNPARWKGHLEHTLSPKSKVRQVRHQPAMPFEELPAFLALLRSREGISAISPAWCPRCTSSCATTSSRRTHRSKRRR